MNYTLKGFPGKLSEFSIFLAWPAILDIYSHGLLVTVLLLDITPFTFTLEKILFENALTS